MASDADFYNLGAVDDAPAPAGDDSEFYKLGAIDDSQSPNMPNTWESKVSQYSQPAWNNGLGAVVLGLSRMGGNLIGDAGTALTKAGAKHLGSFLQNTGNTSTNATPQQFGIENPGIGTNITAGVAQASPYILGSFVNPELLTSDSLASAPYVGKLLSKPVQSAFTGGALYGATQSEPGTALKSAGKDALIGAGIASVPGYLKGMYGLGSDIKNAFTNGNVRKGLSTVYNSIANKLSPADLNNKVVSNILDNYKTHLDESTDQYNAILNGAEERGYGSSADPNISKSKQIIPSQETKEGLEELLNEDNSKNLPYKLRNSIKSHLDNPTYKSAHNLQSDLGDYAAGIKTSESSTMPEKDIASLILGNKNEPGIRRNIVSDIHNNFQTYGDNDLSNAYSAASKYWKENVLPYRSVSQIRNAVLNNKPINNINNILFSNDPEENYLNAIRSHIKSSPNQTSDLTANVLNDGAVKSANNTYKVNANKMSQIYNSLPSYIKETLPQSTNDLLQKLSALNEKNSSNFSTMKKAVKLGIAGAVGKKAFEYLE